MTAAEGPVPVIMQWTGPVPTPSCHLKSPWPVSMALAKWQLPKPGHFSLGRGAGFLGLRTLWLSLWSSWTWAALSLKGCSFLGQPIMGWPEQRAKQILSSSAAFLEMTVTFLPWSARVSLAGSLDSPHPLGWKEMYSRTSSDRG